MVLRRRVMLAGAVTVAVVGCVTVSGHRRAVPPAQVLADGGVCAAPPAGAPVVGPDGGVHVVGECHPTPGALGNSRHVGAYCTKHGHECSGFKGGANKCAADLDARGAGFCVKIFCHEDADCGEAACCYGEPGALAKACIPVGCLSDAGVCPG